MYNQANQHIFVCGVRLGHQQCQCGQAQVIDHGLAIGPQQTAVAVQKVHKKVLA